MKDISTCSVQIAAMFDEYTYAQENFEIAVRRLAVGNGTIQARLAHAAGALTILGNDEHFGYLPEILRPEFRALWIELANEHAVVLDPKSADYEQPMTDERAMELAGRILDLQLKIQQ